MLFISMDGVSGLEEGAKAIFKDVEQLFAYGSAEEKLCTPPMLLKASIQASERLTKKVHFQMKMHC